MLVKSAPRVVFMVAMLALSGCGGGGGAPGVTGVPPAMPDGPPRGIMEAARNPPVGGASVVQSSADGADAAPSDVVARVAWRPDGGVDYRLSRGADFVDSGDDATRTPVNRRGISAASGLTVTAVVALKGRSRGTGASAGVLTDGIGVAFHTDLAGPDDRDYLVWGSWTDVPEEPGNRRDIAQGAFATGSDLFRPEALARVRGTARYRGDVRGMYFAPDRTPAGGYSFFALVNLHADFGDGESPGAIGGNIENFLFQVSEVGGSHLSRPGAAVTLRAAPLDGTDGGLFDGATTGTFDDGTPLSGRWGGRFYGNAEADGAPGAVAGTFGAAGAEGSVALVGAFGAPRQ